MQNFDTIFQRLNQEQKQAVEYLEGPLLVLAGPGTGKTQLLSAKVAYILKNTDTSPENILCVTFTDSGCQNMRDRLASMIGAVPASKVNIHTYHTLGTDILHFYKNYSESFSRNLDSAIDEVTQYKIIKNIQKNLDGTDILKGDRISDIVETISNAKSYRLSADNLQKIAQINLEESKILSKYISPLLEKLIPRKLDENLHNVYQPIYELLSSYEDETPILYNISHIITNIKNDLSFALNETNEQNSIKPLSNWKDKYFEKNNLKQYCLKDRIANKKLLSLSNVMRKYDSYLKENGLYDFDDMIQEAISALKSDDGFRYSLQERFQFILLDEFQDTNPSQFEIIKQLTDYEKPLLMAVGDDDQAIYEFQGAKASNLKDFKEHYNAKVINLVINYRSTQDILDFSKKIIDQVPDSFTKSEPNIEKNLTAFFKDKTGKIERHEFLSSDGEYYWISEKISALIKAGTHQSDIAILTPKYKYITPLLPYLHTHPEIKLAYDHSENILEDDKIHKLITLAKFIYGLSQGKAPSYLLPEILSFPFWNIDNFEVLNIIRSARLNKRSSLDCLNTSENEKCKELSQFFAKLATKSFDTPLNTFINYLLGTTPLDDFTSPFLEYYASDLTTFESFELFEKLSVLFNKIKKHNQNLTEVPKLKDLITLIEDYESAEKSITNSSPYQEANDAVSIYSAHKAKGLEFKHVFIIAADHTAWGKGKGNNNLLSLPNNLAQIRHTGVSEGERLRLLFVAITRAESYLYITNSLKDFAEKSPARLEYFNESEQDLENEKKLISPYIPKTEEKIVNQHYLDSENIKKETNLSTSWLDIYTNPNPNMMLLYQNAVKNYKLSSTALSDFIDIIYSGPESFFKKVILKVPNDPITPQIAYGNAIHKVFEQITTSKITDEDALELFKREVSKEELEPEDVKEMLEKGTENLAISLKTFGKNLRAPFTYAEVDFSAEHLSFNGVPITGKIDHLEINPDEKTIEIYDFKTSKYQKDNWGSTNHTLFKYSLQLNFYKLLLNLSPAYKNYKIKSAHILFVNPDKDQNVFDKEYTFNDKDWNMLLELIPVIYAHMQTLDFLKNKELYQKPDNTKKLKDIFNYIDLLKSTL